MNIVLVHGGWHGGWAWDDVAGRLRDLGHAVFTPSLTGLAERGKDEVREQLTGTLSSAATVPAQLAAVLFAWSEEARKVSYFTLPEAAAKFTAPDEAKLKETWEQTKRQFVVPEQRTLGVLTLSLDALKRDVKISDDEIKTYFDANRDSLDIPERRRVQQVRFKTKAAAEEARTAILGGKSFLKFHVLSVPRC